MGATMAMAEVLAGNGAVCEARGMLTGVWQLCKGKSVDPGSLPAASLRSEDGPPGPETLVDLD